MTTTSRERRPRASLRRLRPSEIVGRKFGDLTPVMNLSSFNGVAIWKCVCDCGRSVKVLQTALLDEFRISCSGPGRKCHSRYGPPHPVKKSLIGFSNGRLTAVRLLGSYHGRNYYECRCSCGRYVDVAGIHITSGNTSSCGCLQKETTSEKFRGQTHTVTHGLTKHPLHRTWLMMRSRCSNPKDSSYKNYGGRGIRVCDRWNDFANFLKDMGERPDGMTLDRKDVDGDYTPENCRWATTLEQNRNKTNTVFVEIDGVKESVPAASERLGIKQHILRRLAKRQANSVS